MRKLTAALIKNASSKKRLESVLFVIVDLINRIGCDTTSPLEERALYAQLNLRAAKKAIEVPDFAGAARYSESGITFLAERSWESHYNLSLNLFETAVLSHFSRLEGDKDQLMKRINTVFEHAKDFSDKFKTHCVWIKLLAMTDVPGAIQESLIALERLGEPLDLGEVDLKTVYAELVRRKEQFSGEMRTKFLSINCLADRNKERAMKIMSSLVVYYHLQKSFLGAYVTCCMMTLSLKHGHCEDTVFGAAGFASSLVNILGDVEEGTVWARSALSLMKLYDEKVLIPSIYGPLYGMVFVWKGKPINVNR